jgi:D-inositol-3-phosphate glycosyltransferase
MKIVFVGPSHPFRGGIAAFNDRLAVELQNEGHEIVMYTFSLQYPSFLFPGKSQYSESEKPHNIKVVESINSINPFSWLKVARQVRKENADLIISRFWIPFMGPSLGSIMKWSKNKKTKVISIVDNAIPHESRPGDKVLTKYFVNNSDAFMTLSQEVKKDLRTFEYRKEIWFTPHPLYDHYGDLLDTQLAKTKLNLDTSKKYILFFGLIREYKGLDLLLEAYASTNEIHDSVEIIIAGEYYDKRDKYDQMITELGIENKIHQSEGFIPDEEVNQYFSAADVIIQPYKTATQSGVTQVAYHFEKPMIITDVGGLAEICPNEKVGYISQANPKDLSNQISKFFKSESSRFLADIKYEKAKYSWSIFTDKLMKLYHHLD